MKSPADENKGASGMAGHADPLDQALASLPREVQPARDLWPAIATSLSEVAAVRPAVYRSPYFLLAAALLLTIASSFTTYFVMRHAQQRELVQLQEQATEQLLQAPAMPAMPASFADERLGAEYMQARAALETQFERRLASLPPAARAKLQSDLADLRRAAAEIATTLDTHPNHPLLQELLLSTYQSELALLSGVNEMTRPAAETRL